MTEQIDPLDFEKRDFERYPSFGWWDRTVWGYGVTAKAPVSPPKPSEGRTLTSTPPGQNETAEDR